MKPKQTTKPSKPAKQSSSWIDVEDRRPPFGKDVLICCTEDEDYENGITIGYLDQEIKTYNSTTKAVETKYLFEQLGSIGPCSFWQPLPELPTVNKKTK